MKKKKNKIKIDDDKIGTLRMIAKKEGAIKSNGEISRVWARNKMNNPRTSASVKKKINFMLNMNNK